MKKHIYTFLLVGFVAFLAASCSPSTGNPKNKKDNSETTQTTSEASGTSGTPNESSSSGSTTNPDNPNGQNNPQPVQHNENSNYPKFIYENAYIPENASPGAQVVSQTYGEIKVIPNKNGLLVTLDYSKRTDSTNWEQVKILVQDITDENNWVAAVEAGPFDIHTTGNNGEGNNLPTEFLFPFVKAGNKYRVSYIHWNKDWSNYVNESDEHNYAEVTAIGGLGNINVHMKRENLLFLTPEPKLYLDRLTLNLPSCLENVEAEWDVHAEFDDRWGANAKDDKFPFTGDFITNLNRFDDDNFHFSGQDKIFFNVSYTFTYNNVDYSQWLVNNDDRWFRDINSTGNEHFPLIKIKSTQNYGGMKFVLEPIAKHVKESANSWGDHSNDDIQDPWYETCEIYDGDNLIGTGQVKVRGNWTTSYAKKSLRIKFDDKQKMLGLNGNKKFKNWVLLADWKDASLLRNAVALKMYHELFPGYASDARLVEVEVNGSNLGVYLLAEQQEAKRLGLTEPDKNATNTDIGYLIEFDSYYYSEKANEQFEIDYTIGNAANTLCDYNGTPLIDPQAGYTIKSDITCQAQHDFIENYMNKLWEICYKATHNGGYYTFNEDKTDLVDFTGYDPNDDEDTVCRKCIDEIIDLGSLADFYIFNEIVCDPDLYLTSFFMNLDFAEGKERKLTFNAPWDFDSTMGNKSFAIPDPSVEENQYNNKESDYMCRIDEMFAGLCQTDVNCTEERTHANPWMVIFINETWFKDLVKERFKGLKDSGKWAETLSTLENFINANSTSELQPTFSYTRSLWNTPADNNELCNKSREAAETSQEASAQYLKFWLSYRWGYVDTIITGL
ncbi:MAG: CotH kinase family protein [Treponema sp.]|nr:CotH kinase family protein [Treponema sp.]